LLTYAEASDLKFGVPPEGCSDDLATCIRAGIIPNPLRKELLEQQITIKKQEQKLSEINRESNDEIRDLLDKTARMDQAVLSLRNMIEMQREAVKTLVHDAKGCGREAERSLHEARRIGSGKNVHMVDRPIPSDFFWRLLNILEARMNEYSERTNELYRMLYGSSVPGGVQRMDQQSPVGAGTVINILRKQHQGFKAIASIVAQVHEKMDELREQYHDWNYLLTGEAPKDFQQEDNAERERQRRLLRKVEENAQQANITGLNNNPTANSQQQQQLGTTATGANTGGGLFGNTNAQSTSNTSGGLFGNTFGNNNTQQNTGGGLFGNTSNTNSGGSLFGNTNAANNPNATEGLFGNTNTGGSLFGNTNQQNTNTQQNTAGDLFGNTSNTNGGGSLFGNTNQPNISTTNTNASGGIFGSTPTQPDSGLFGGANANTGAPRKNPRSRRR